MLKRDFPGCELAHLFAGYMMNAELVVFDVVDVHVILQLTSTGGTNLNISFREGFQKIQKRFYLEQSVFFLSPARACGQKPEAKEKDESVKQLPSSLPRRKSSSTEVVDRRFAQPWQRLEATQASRLRRLG